MSNHKDDYFTLKCRKDKHYNLEKTQGESPKLNTWTKSVTQKGANYFNFNSKKDKEY